MAILSGFGMAGHPHSCSIVLTGRDGFVNNYLPSREPPRSSIRHLSTPILFTVADSYPLSGRFDRTNPAIQRRDISNRCQSPRYFIDNPG
jgi:hypothetical protein